MILSVENGCFSYKHSKDNLLENINFSVEPGDLVAILGPNGAGKTTLLRCIMGFLKWNSGKSTLDGENIRDIPHKKALERYCICSTSKIYSSSLYC